MSTDFVAALLEGFQGTLDEILARLQESELRREVEALQRHLAAVKESCLSRCETAGSAAFRGENSAKADAI